MFFVRSIYQYFHFHQLNNLNSIFKYNGNAKHSTKDLKRGYTAKVFRVLNVYLNEKGPTVKIQLLNIFNDYHIAPKRGPKAIG